MKTIILIVAISLCTIFAACNSNRSAKKDKSSGSDDAFLGVNFSNGKYALYIKHKELGEFMVINEEALQENQDQLKVNVSFFNYLPGEGDRSYGIKLFKDNKLIDQKSGGVFRRFETGNLADYAVPVKQRRMKGVKKEIRKQLDSIAGKDNLFITHQSTFVPDNRGFRFRIYFPSIAVPVTRGKDSAGYYRITTINGIEYDEWIMEGEGDFDNRWGKKIEGCIRDKAGSTKDFEVSIAKGSTSNAYLYDKERNDLQTPTKKMLHVEDYMYYNFEAYVMADKNNAEKLLGLDYSDCMSEEERNRPQLIAKVKELVKQSTQPTLKVGKGEVGLSGYKDSIHTYETLYEQEYTLTWLEIEEQNATK